MRDLSKFSALGAATLALALTAAACGGDSDITATASDSQVAEDATEPAADSASADDEGADGGSEDGDTNADTTADDSATADTDASAESADDTGADEAAADEGAASAPSPPVWASAEEAEAAANQNIGSLQSAEDVLDIQVLSVHDGAVSSLREAVTGDRPVLLWFYAPH